MDKTTIKAFIAWLETASEEEIEAIWITPARVACTPDLSTRIHSAAPSTI